MNIIFKNHGFRVELSCNVAIQKKKRDHLAQKVQKTALVIIFFIGVIAARAFGAPALAILLGALARDLIFESSEDSFVHRQNPVDRVYFKFFEITLDPQLLKVKIL